MLNAQFRATQKEAERVGMFEAILFFPCLFSVTRKCCRMNNHVLTLGKGGNAEEEEAG